MFPYCLDCNRATQSFAFLCVEVTVEQRIIITRRRAGFLVNHRNREERCTALLLVESGNIFLPPLHIKLGLQKNFVRAMDQTRLSSKCLSGKFTAISAAKSRMVLFIGPHIRQLFGDGEFDRILSCNEMRAWNYFGFEAAKFLGNNKADN